MTAHYQIFGRVQGVGYRFYIVGVGRRLGIDGWVRNRPDGSVEAVARGSAQQLDQLAQHLRQGPPSAQVLRMDHRPLTDEAGAIRPGIFETIHDERTL